jgi:transcription elongation factor Elf1
VYLDFILSRVSSHIPEPYHMMGKTFRCPVCTFQRSSRTKVNAHILANRDSKHAPLAERLLQCKNCPKKFTTSHARTNHEPVCEVRQRKLHERSGVGAYQDYLGNVAVDDQTHWLLVTQRKLHEWPSFAIDVNVFRQNQRDLFNSARLDSQGIRCPEQRKLIDFCRYYIPFSK